MPPVRVRHPCTRRAETMSLQHFSSPNVTPTRCRRTAGALTPSRVTTPRASFRPSADLSAALCATADRPPQPYPADKRNRFLRKLHEIRYNDDGRELLPVVAPRSHHTQCSTHVGPGPVLITKHGRPQWRCQVRTRQPPTRSRATQGTMTSEHRTSQPSSFYVAARSR